MSSILDIARQRVLEQGRGLTEAQVLEVLRLPDERIEEALQLAHEVRMRWCGPEVEVEGIVSLKTGGCPEDCHFCSQSGRFETPRARCADRRADPRRGCPADRRDRRHGVLHRGGGSRARTHV